MFRISPVKSKFHRHNETNLKFEPVETKRQNPRRKEARQKHSFLQHHYQSSFGVIAAFQMIPIQSLAVQVLRKIF